MTQNEFKVGDGVRHLGFNLYGIITDFLGEGFVKVKAIEDEVFSTWDINNLELCDRKTAFLRELQALLRKYDADICYKEGDCEMHIDLRNGNTFDRISIPLEYSDFFECEDDYNGYLEITADNIMDFGKE